MKVENIKFVKSFFMNGLLFAAFMAGFDYYDGHEFDIFKFICMFSFFVLFTGLIKRRNHKTQLKKINGNIINRSNQQME